MATQPPMSKAQRKKAEERGTDSSPGATDVIGDTDSQSPEAGPSDSKSLADDGASVSGLAQIAEEGGEDMQESGERSGSGDIVMKPLTRTHPVRTTSLEQHASAKGATMVTRRQNTLSSLNSAASDQQGGALSSSDFSDMIFAAGASQTSLNTLNNSVITTAGNSSYGIDSVSSQASILPHHYHLITGKVPHKIHVKVYGKILTINLYHFRLNFVLLAILLEIVTSVSPGTNDLDDTQTVSFLGTINTVLVYFPPILFSIFNFEPLSDYFSNVVKSLGDLSPRLSFLNVFCTPALVFTIQMAISFEGLPVKSWLKSSRDRSSAKNLLGCLSFTEVSPACTTSAWRCSLPSSSGSGPRLRTAWLSPLAGIRSPRCASVSQLLSNSLHSSSKHSA
ncbi:hypothetical protein SCHPADRAFT_561685 [Schizopora paradoxa]|uniref:Uncharacterized protein n=1 Tax=Schizopora paradoxa TaxID=27342 RepID=A0A0H2RCK0_9AGAM|nr:hypothetical protein SCHPADRAFT_561685 [Schizopora paradoxa]